MIVEDLLDPDLLARFNAELDPLVAGAQPEHDTKFVNEAIAWFFGAHTRHVTGVAAKSPIFVDEILPHPVYLGVCDAVLGPSCARYQLNIAHVLDRGPGSEQQFLHRDEAVWVHLPKPHPEVQLASVIALVDFTADNGATRVAPGSHRWPDDRVATDADLVPAEMRAGSAVIYLGSDDPRRRRQRHRRRAPSGHARELLRRLAPHRGEPVPVGAARRRARACRARARSCSATPRTTRSMSGGGYLGVVDLRDPVELLADGRL